MDLSVNEHDYRYEIPNKAFRKVNFSTQISVLLVHVIFFLVIGYFSVKMFYDSIYKIVSLNTSEKWAMHNWYYKIFWTQKQRLVNVEHWYI